LKVFRDKERAGFQQEYTFCLRTPKELVGTISAIHAAADNYDIEGGIGHGFLPRVAKVSRQGVDAERSLLTVDLLSRRSHQTWQVRGHKMSSAKNPIRNWLMISDVFDLQD
jgi:hypothetical protein